MRIRPIIGILLIIIFSCDKYEIEEPNIKIELFDDVSPVLVKFSVEEKWNNYEWKFNDLYYPSQPNVKNTAFHIFNPSDSAKVSLKVSTMEKSVTVEKYFSTPPLPTKLIIKGIVFDKGFIESDNTDNFQVNLRLYNGIENIYNTTSFNKAIHKNDTFYFNNPVEYNVSKFILEQEAYLKTYIWVYGQDKNTIIGGEFGNYFNEFFLFRNRYDPSGMQLRNIKHNDSTPVYLIVDWTK